MANVPGGRQHLHSVDGKGGKRGRKSAFLGSSPHPWAGDSSPCRVTGGHSPLQRGHLWRIPGTWGRDCFVFLDHSHLASLWHFEMSAALKLALCSQWQGFLCWVKVISNRSLSFWSGRLELAMGRMRVLLWLPVLSAASQCLLSLEKEPCATYFLYDQANNKSRFRKGSIVFASVFFTQSSGEGSERMLPVPRGQEGKAQEGVCSCPRWQQVAIGEPS